MLVSFDGRWRAPVRRRSVGLGKRAEANPKGHGDALQRSDGRRDMTVFYLGDEAGGKPVSAAKPGATGLDRGGAAGYVRPH